MSLTHGSLFTGIGAFDLAFERRGVKTKWQVEINSYCRKVLAQHFPDAQRFEDVTKCDRHNLKKVDILSGGFPCQDISTAGKGRGLQGERSGLWKEMLRIICELRPRYIIVENVSALLDRGFSTVLRDLATAGFNAEWSVFRASDFGLPHKRERLIIIAYSMRFRFMRPSSQQFRLEQSKIYSHYRAAQVWPYELTERDIVRKIDGLSSRVDELRKAGWAERIHALGNSVVLPLAEYVAECIISAEARRTTKAA